MFREFRNRELSGELPVARPVDERAHPGWMMIDRHVPQAAMIASHGYRLPRSVFVRLQVDGRVRMLSDGERVKGIYR